MVEVEWEQLRLEVEDERCACYDWSKHEPCRWHEPEVWRELTLSQLSGATRAT